MSPSDLAKRGRPPLWTRQKILYAIELWHRTHLRAPTFLEWSRAGEKHPSSRTVHRVFGTWNTAIKAAGLRPCRRGQNRKRRKVARISQIAYRYELRRADEIVATGHLVLEDPVAVGERVTIGGQEAIVRTVEPVVGEGETRLVVQLVRYS